jgi:hypothetical protein
MNERPYEAKPSLGIKIVLLTLCATAGAIAACALVSALWF